MHGAVHPLEGRCPQEPGLALFSLDYPRKEENFAFYPHQSSFLAFASPSSSSLGMLISDRRIEVWMTRDVFNDQRCLLMFDWHLCIVCLFIDDQPFKENLLLMMMMMRRHWRADGQAEERQSLMGSLCNCPPTTREYFLAPKWLDKIN